MIVVAFTTWPPRLDNIPVFLNSIRNQTLKADKIVCTLSHEDFDKVPDCLNVDDIEIHWIEKNIKVWKKLYLVLDLYPEAELINVDDDIIYLSDFIEQLHNKHIATGLPVSPNNANYRGLVHHDGFAALVKSEYFKGYRPTEDVIKNVTASDVWYSFVIYMNGYKYARCIECFDKRKILPSPSPYTAPGCNVNKQWEWLLKYYNFYKF